MFYSVRFPLKTVSWCLAVAAVALLAGGCMFMSDEDREFYGKGWVKPSDLDKPLPHHAIPDPSHPYYQEPTDAPARTASAAPDSQWLIPEQAPH